MNITEADRIDMLAELRRCHGERVGDIIVEHLPPTGWGDVARVSDITRLENHVNTEIDRVRADISRLEKRIDRLTTAMMWISGIFVTCFGGLYGLIATKL